MIRKIKTIGFITLSTTFLCSCTALQRLSEVNEPPRLSEITNPLANPNYTPVTTPMPMTYEENYSGENSLWKTGARGFFKDQRAQRVGDILTINISINDKATMKDDTTSARQNTETMDAINFFGYEKYLGKIFPSTVNKASLLDYSSNPTHTGTGKIDRSDVLDTKVAAIINQILPNGNLVVSGRQEVRVNNELRELLITGIVRPEDISSSNEISYERIAEARISYGGRGMVSDLNQLPWGQQVLHVLNPG